MRPRPQVSWLVLLLLLIGSVKAVPTALEKLAQHAQTAYKDEANVFTHTSGQTFRGATNTFGPGSAGDVTITADNGDANKPKVRFNDSTNKWQFTNDGTTWIDIPTSAGGSTPIGSLAYGTAAPDGTYLKADGQALSQSTYSTLYSKVGTTPDFTSEMHTVQPGANSDSAITKMAYSSSLGVYVGGGTANTGLWYSYDGFNWLWGNTATAPVNFNVNDVDWCSGLGMFVAAVADGNNNGSVWTSRNGIRWEISRLPSGRNATHVSCSSSVIAVFSSSHTDGGNQFCYTSTDGITWTQRTMATTNKTPAYVYYWSSASLFVFGATDGTIQTSPTGTTWTARTSNISTSIVQIAASPSLIVAISSSQMSTSPDGTTWTSRAVTPGTGIAYGAGENYPWVMTSSSNIQVSTDGITWMVSHQDMGNSLYGLTYGNGVYVQGGENNFARYSTDLLTWTPVNPQSGNAASDPTVAAFGNGIFVLAGTSFNFGYCVSTSTDGATWTNRVTDAAGPVSKVIYAGGSINLFVALGGSTGLMTSPDGITWTGRTHNITSPGNIVYKGSPDLLVITGANGTIATSTNATTWTARTSATSQALNGVAWDGSKFCAVKTDFSTAGLIVVTSSDGITWTKEAHTGLYTNTIWSVTSDGAGTFFVTSPNFCFLSTNDGVAWTAYATPAGIRAVSHLNGALVTSDGKGNILKSSNGKTWTVEGQGGPFPTNSTLLYYFNGRFITHGGHIQSVDGQNWTFNTEGKLLGVAHSSGSGITVAVGEKNTILTSTTSGVTWTASYDMTCTGTTLGFNDVTYSPSLNLFALVGSSASATDLMDNGSTSTAAVLTSTNGVTWTQQELALTEHGANNPSAAFNAICWSVAESLFVAVGSPGLIATSSNGTTWTLRDNGGIDQILFHVCYNAALDKFLAVGVRGFTATSSNGTTWTANVTGLHGTLIGCASVESNGFIAVTRSGQILHSLDGVSWTLRPVLGGTLSAGKPMYSSVDGVAFIPLTAMNTSTSGFIWETGNGAILATNDGSTFTNLGVGGWEGYNSSGGGFWMPQPKWTAITYDSTNDKYVLVGKALVSRGTSFSASLTRTYNKATHFALPRLNNTWVKVSN